MKPLAVKVRSVSEPGTSLKSPPISTGFSGGWCAAPTPAVRAPASTRTASPSDFFVAVGQMGRVGVQFNARSKRRSGHASRPGRRVADIAGLPPWLPILTCEEYLRTADIIGSALRAGPSVRCLRRISIPLHPVRRLPRNELVFGPRYNSDLPDSSSVRPMSPLWDARTISCNARIPGRSCGYSVGPAISRRRSR